MKHLEKDAQILAVEVVSLWKGGKSSEAKTLCDNKITGLCDRYAPSTVVKDCHRIYRKAIAIEAGLDPVGYRFTDEPMCLFQVPIKTTTAVNDDSRDTVETQRNVLMPITREIIDRYLEFGVRLVQTEVNKGQDIYNKAVGLTILTGRRMYAETLHHAAFEAVDDSNVVFTGQAKGGIEKREIGYTIPVLGVKSSVIVEAQNQVTEYITNREWYSPELTDKEISGKCKKQVQQCISLYVDPIFNSIRLAGYDLDPLSPHDLRKAYAFIVWVVKNRQRSGFTQFAPEILGHSYTVKHSGRVRGNTRSSESYDKFRLVDCI